MSRVAIQASATGTGTVTLAAPVTNTDRTIVLPDSAGTILTTATPGVPIGGPAFSAYMSANQTVSSSTYTKVQFDQKPFDTNSNFNTALSRFTPTVAGYYQVNISVFFAPGSATAVLAALYKNGAMARRFDCYSTSGSLDDWSTTGSVLIYMNGSTDFLELYGLIVSGSPAFTGGQAYSAFDAFLARSAT